MQICRSFAASAVALLVALGATACGGGDDEAAPPPVVVNPPPPAPPGTLIGPSGGTVTGPNGANVVIPAGALSAEVRILIEQTAAGAPSLPSGFTVAGLTYSLTPHGTTFAVPVTLTLPFDPALVPAGATPSLMKTINAQTEWQEIPGVSLSANTVSASVTGFSFAGAALSPSIEPRAVGREWSFNIFRGDGLTPEVVDERIDEGGALTEIRDFGTTNFDSPLIFPDGTSRSADNIANGAIGSTADGLRFFVAAEAPFGNAGRPGDPIGSSVKLRQVQTFVKRADDATMSITLPRVFMDLHDRNAVLHRLCPPHHADGLRCSLLHTRLGFKVFVYNTADPDIELIDSLWGEAQVDGFAENWHSEAFTSSPSRVPVWTVEDFDFDIESEVANGAAESHVVMTLRTPKTFALDLSTIALGRAFHVEIETFAFAYNRIAGPPSEFATSAGAYLMEAPGVGGPVLTSTGLETASTPAGLVLPGIAVTEPGPCVPGPAPQANAGQIQFAEANYSVSESTGGQVIEVTRTGGSVGAVSATFATSDGSAVAGTDYATARTTVFFADGDSEPRVVEVRPIEDDVGDEPVKTVNLTLSQPGGCAALGTRTTAVLTIRDDDPPPEAPSFTIGGTVSGLVGTGLELEDLQRVPMAVGNGPFEFPLPIRTGRPYAVTVTRQPVNPVQICTVVGGSGTITNQNVTNIAVNCVTPGASGALDSSFGGTGKVSTVFGGDETGMVLQPDGKIVMVGGNGGTGPDFALARYNADGTLDGTFGAAGTGLVTTDLAGSADDARAVALQSNGKIIVVGSSRVGASDDFAVVRYNTNGTLDTTFGTLGKVTTDFAGARDRALAVAILPDDRIVVVGEVIMPAPGNSDFGVARYTANGAPDNTFDADGKLNTDIGGGVDIAQNVVVQGDRILVSGVITLNGSPVLEHGGIARYGVNGALDANFATAGKRTFPGQSLGEGLALQADGRILVAGHLSVGNDRHFALMRLDANGGTDGSFGTGGLSTTAFSTQDDFGRAVAVHPDGRIFVAGQSSNTSNPDFGLACFTSGGVLDGGFDADGRLTIDFFGSFDGAENVAIQPDGRIVVSGFAGNGNRTNYALARIQP